MLLSEDRYFGAHPVVAYVQFDIVSAKVDIAVARGDKVLAWWRGSAAAHFECAQYDAREYDSVTPEFSLILSNPCHVSQLKMTELIHSRRKIPVRTPSIGQYWAMPDCGGHD